MNLRSRAGDGAGGERARGRAGSWFQGGARARVPRTSFSMGFLWMAGLSFADPGHIRPPG